MKNRPSVSIPMLLVILLFAAGMIGVIRSGYLISLWTFYRLAGIETVAVIETSEQYQYIVRKPRPSRYVNGFRGTYGFDLDASGIPAGHFTGRFDSRDLIGFTEVELREGDRITVLYSRFDPSVSRPADEMNKIHLLIPIIIIVPSLFALLLSSILFYFNLSGSAHVDKYSAKIVKKQRNTGPKEDTI